MAHVRLVMLIAGEENTAQDIADHLGSQGIPTEFMGVWKPGETFKLAEPPST